MPPDEIAVFMSLGFMFATYKWIRAAVANRRIKKQMMRMAEAYGLPASALGDNPGANAGELSSPRVEELENQVDLIAEHLNRLEESQEFLSRVLTDRLDKITDPGLVTPH